MRLRLHSLGIAFGTAAMLASCGDGGAATKSMATQPGATLAAGAPKADPKLNMIDRSHAGTPAPDIAFETHGGDTRHISDFAGKKVLVNLWATWCAPCIAEMPQLDQLAASRRGKTVVLPISQDMEGWLAVNKFFTPGKFNTLEPYVDQPGSYAESIKARGLPVSILYDEKGREIWRVAGTPDWSALAMEGII